MASLNTGYLSSNRGVVKILQIILGFIICSLVCVNWYSERSCLYDGRLAFTSVLSFVVVNLNIIIFLANFLGIGMSKVECIYSIICSFLFLIAAIFLIWHLLVYDIHRAFLLAAEVLVLSLLLLCLLDIKIIRGEIPDE